MRFRDCRLGILLFKWSVRNDFPTSVWVTAHHSRRRRRFLRWEAEPVGTEGTAGNRWPFLSASLPRNIGQSQRGDNTFTAPTGRLKPVGQPVEKPVVTGHLGRGRHRLYPGPGQTVHAAAEEALGCHSGAMLTLTANTQQLISRHRHWTFPVFIGPPPSRSCIAARCQMEMWHNHNRFWKHCVRLLQSLKKKNKISMSQEAPSRFHFTRCTLKT